MKKRNPHYFNLMNYKKFKDEYPIVFDIRKLKKHTKTLHFETVYQFNPAKTSIIKSFEFKIVRVMGRTFILIATHSKKTSDNVCLNTACYVLLTDTRDIPWQIKLTKKRLQEDEIPYDVFRYVDLIRSTAYDPNIVLNLAVYYHMKWLIQRPKIFR